MPGPKFFLAGLLVLRVILLVMLLKREPGRMGGPLTAAVAIAAVVAALSLIWMLRPRPGFQAPPIWALLLQAIIDVLLVTSLVAAEGREATALAAFYIALLTIYALLLPLGRALFLVLLVGGGYSAVTLLYGGGAAPEVDFWAQLAVVVGVGMLVALLGHRLASAAQEQQTLALALEQARLEAEEILGTIQSGVITIDSAGVLRYLNPRGRKILGARFKDFTPGKPIMATLRVSSPGLHQAISKGLLDGSRVSRGEALVNTTGGGSFPVGLSTTTFHRPGREGILVTGIFTDISDLKQLQEFRMRNERLEAVSALSASLAHEIRNPLAAIRSAVEQLAAGAGEDEDERVLANLVMRESERLNRLLKEFLDFSKVRATVYERVDLYRVVNEVLETVKGNPAAESIRIELKGRPLQVEVDVDLIHRMVSNLVLNAVQALAGERGEDAEDARVEVRIEWVDSGEGSRGSSRRPIRLTVTDNGPGIPAMVQERLFEPFITGRIGGTGLGLPIVQRAVAAHGGVILVDSRPEIGTTFKIYLPENWNGEATA